LSYEAGNSFQVIQFDKDDDKAQAEEILEPLVENQDSQQVDSSKTDNIGQS